MTTTRRLSRSTTRQPRRVDSPSKPPTGPVTGSGSSITPTTIESPNLGPADGSSGRFVEAERERGGQPRTSTPHHSSTTVGGLDEDPLRTRAEQTLALYAPGAAAQPRAAQRVLFWVGELHTALSTAASQPDLAKGAMHRDMRTAAFMLEASLRLYRDKYGKPLDEARKDVKKLEDLLGALGHAQDMQKAGVGCSELPAEARAYLDRQVAKETEKLLELLGSGWLPGAQGTVPVLDDVVETVLHTDWKKGDGDRKAIRKALGRQLDEVAAGGLDMNELQEGLHELRRQLRWVPIYGMALKGAVVLDDTLLPEPRYAALRDDPVASSPFAALPTSAQDKHPLRLSRTVFLRSTQLIDELGTIKDQGESIEGLAKALRKADVVEGLEASEQEAARLLGLDPHAMDAVKARATLLYPEVRRVAELFAADLRAQD
ncbi:MAG: hypothetical protein ABIJ09_20455 [Pseudomonadota bacterium]